MFERYRRALMGIPFPPALRAQYYLQTAEGYEALAEPVAAANAGRCALDLAREFGYHKLVFDAEALIQRVQHHALVARNAADGATPPALMEIAEHLGEMRRLVPG